jgi:hypothetical protein
MVDQDTMVPLRKSNCLSRDRNTAYLADRSKPSKTAASRLIRHFLRPDESGATLILTALMSSQHRSRQE